MRSVTSFVLSFRESSGRTNIFLFFCWMALVKWPSTLRTTFLPVLGCAGEVFNQFSCVESDASSTIHQQSCSYWNFFSLFKQFLKLRQSNLSFLWLQPDVVDDMAFLSCYIPHADFVASVMLESSLSASTAPSCTSPELSTRLPSWVVVRTLMLLMHRSIRSFLFPDRAVALISNRSDPKLSQDKNCISLAKRFSCDKGLLGTRLGILPISDLTVPPTHGTACSKHETTSGAALWSAAFSTLFALMILVLGYMSLFFSGLTAVATSTGPWQVSFLSYNLKFPLWRSRCGLNPSLCYIWRA